MGNLADYFERKAYKPKYFIGDRVFGHYNKIPFVATVGNDTLISELEGPYIVVHLDLPLQYEGQVLTTIKVKHRDVKPFK